MYNNAKLLYQVALYFIKKLVFCVGDMIWHFLGTMCLDGRPRPVHIDLKGQITVLRLKTWLYTSLKNLVFCDRDII